MGDCDRHGLKNRQLRKDYWINCMNGHRCTLMSHWPMQLALQVFHKRLGLYMKARVTVFARCIALFMDRQAVKDGLSIRCIGRFTTVTI